MLAVIALLVIGGMTWYVLEDDERRRVLRTVRPAVAGVRALAAAGRTVPVDPALCARMSIPMATYGLLAMNAAVGISMLAAPGAMGDPDNLLRWGASLGTRTTNGEWPRLLTAMFVHTGAVTLLVNAMALAKVGLLTERLTGPLAFACAYFASGLVASGIALATDPLAIAAGASGAIAGTIGLLAAALAWMWLRPGALRVPLATIRPSLPFLVVFGLFALISGALPLDAELGGFATGFAIGAIAAPGVSERTLPVRLVSAPVAVALAVAAAIALPLRGITDAEPAIARVVEVEHRIAGAYEKAVGQFRLGAMSAVQLARLIEGSIVPELAEVERQVGALERVPPAQQSMLDAAREYLRLRRESWDMRRDALARSNMVALRAADQKERESLRAFDRLKPASAP